MDIFFSNAIYREVADFVASRYPASSVALIGGSEELGNMLSDRGIKTGGDEARAVVALGGEKAIAEAKGMAKGLPLVLAPDYAYGDIFANYIISGINLIKCGYPNAIFYDTGKSYGGLSASAYAGAFGLYAEVMELATSALRSPMVIAARNLLGECRDNLFAELSAEELIVKTAAIKERLTDGEAGIFSIARAIHKTDGGDGGAASYFMTAYVAVLMAIRFTNFDFCSILLGKDNVRARILEERLKLPRAEAAKARRDISPYKAQVERYVMSEAELNEALMRFRLETGGAEVDLRVILNDLAMASDYTESGGVVTELARSGFIDAIIDETA